DHFEQNVKVTSMALYVIRGQGKTSLKDNGEIIWNEGDLMVIPYTGGEAIVHSVSNDQLEQSAALYYVHDGPLLRYLNVVPNGQAFTTTVFRAKVLKEKVASIREQLGAEHRNRLGALVGNPNTQETKSLTHVLWALMNVLPAKSMQKPH
ncbi:unnamed protein product, partial [Didymodactylos carnosus]